MTLPESSAPVTVIRWAHPRSIPQMLCRICEIAPYVVSSARWDDGILCLEMVSSCECGGQFWVNVT